MEMQTQVALPSVREIADFFFEGSLRGYASGKKANPHFLIGMPMAKCYTHQQGELFYLDVYFVGTDGFSWGWTMIWHAGRPVWEMSYQGRCAKKEVIPFLKKCLYAAYDGREFHGGRAKSGPREGNLAYFNSWETDFTNFHGTDRISMYDLDHPDANGNEVYYHSYQGMLLIPADEEYLGSLVL